MDAFWIIFAAFIGYVAYPSSAELVIACYSSPDFAEVQSNTVVIKQPNDALPMDVANALRYASDHLPLYAFFVFGNATTPLPPIPESPFYGSTVFSTAPSLRWNSSPGAVSYELQVSTDSNFAIIVYNESSILDTSKQISGLGVDSTYYWRVRASDAGATSGWSRVSVFKTQLQDGRLPSRSYVLDDFDYNTASNGNDFFGNRGVWNTPSAIIVASFDSIAGWNHGLRLDYDVSQSSTEGGWWEQLAFDLSDTTNSVFNLSRFEEFHFSFKGKGSFTTRFYLEFVQGQFDKSKRIEVTGVSETLQEDIHPDQLSLTGILL